LYKSATCGFCKQVQAIWEDLSNIHKPTVTKTVKEIYPGIKIKTVSAIDNSGIFDYKKYPKGLQVFNKWFPMILMIPGKLWNEAMNHLTKNPPVNLTQGTYILNGVFENNTIVPDHQFDHQNIDSIVEWVKFVVQTKSKEIAMGGPPNDVPKKIFSKEGILPTQVKMNPILKPIESSSHKEKKKKDKESIENVCFMNIIARP
jgi:hypothetical protein